MWLLLLSIGCTPVDARAARKAWLQEQLVADNRAFLSREPQRVADKFDRMAADPYDFLRGTNRLWLADQADPTHPRPPTHFLTVDAARAALLIGDAHPENLSTYEPARGDDIPVVMIDLDAAAYGPYTLDLARAALGLQLLTAALPGCTPAACADPAVAALARGYAQAIAGAPDALALAEEQDEDEDRVAAAEDEDDDEGDEDDDTGEGPAALSLLDRLRDDAAEDGAARLRLLERTTPGPDGQRRLRFDEGLDAAHAGLLPLAPAEAAQVRALFAAAPLPAGRRLLDAGRRYGVGVGSLPALRYALLIDQGDPSDADDALIELRELTDPPALPGAPAQPFDSNADRVTTAAQRLWPAPVAAPGYFALQVDGLSWRALPWSSYVQGLDHLTLAADLEAGDLTLDSTILLGEELGAILAQGQLRAGLPAGEGLGIAIAADLDAGGGPARLAAELGAQARVDADHLFTDYTLFLELLDEAGPLLGADGLRPDL